MKQRTKIVRQKRSKRLLKSEWLFNARKKGNQTEKEKRTANCTNNEFD
jgi:hypothetical protein